MCSLQQMLPSRLYEVTERAGISTGRQILKLSIWDIKKLTCLSIEDIYLLKNMVADNLLPLSVSSSKLIHNEHNGTLKVTTGCTALNHILQGGFRRGTLTELFGESGTGKTQIAIQASVHNWPSSVLYICTEDMFPIKRLNEIKKSIPNYDPTVDYGKSIFVEHIIEAKDLINCVKVRLPKLLAVYNFALIVIDSVAAPFRVDNTNYVERAEELRELSLALIQTSKENNLAILCINQVTAAIDHSNNMIPSLGLAWSNMISTRLWIRKSMKTVEVNEQVKQLSNHKESFDNKLKVRELLVTFAPDLANSVVEFVITSKGIESIE